mmetsp:Transcript_1662/g.4833  ORF Transcript_1662/g.4833 Transcript_1662/m.4833 type:complete len:481 (+) Transcript_1662:174-1616(+)
MLQIAVLLLGHAHAAPHAHPPRHWYEDNFRPAPWRCDEPRSRANVNLCFPFDDSLRDDGSEDVRLYNMAPESIPTNRTCCGLPPVQCPADKEYPLKCLLEKIPFSKPPACVKRQFQCCLAFWNAKFGLEDTYRKAPPHVRCKGRLWDVFDIRADDVIFDQRSLMKLAAAFYPKILVPYEDEMMAPADRVHPVWREYVVLAKLGFGWINVESAKPDALILAQNLLRNPQRPTHPGGAYSLPRGVKDLRPWRDHCLDNVNSVHVRCVGMKLHRDRVKKFRALMRHGICPATGNDAHTGKVDHGYYVQAMSDATYVPSPPGVGFVNYRDTEAIVAGAVPILERPMWPPQRGPVVELHDELPHVLVKNDTAWASLRNDLDHLPSHRPAGDARKHYLPYWLYFILKRLRAANVTEATCTEPSAEKVEAKVHTSCRWAAIGAPWDNLAVNMGPFQNVGRRRIAKPRAWGGEGAWRRKVGRPSGAAY